MTTEQTVPDVSGAPDLEGFSPVRYLGGGGFADVFLYRQRRPSREVAVKVLKATAAGQQAADFDAEADLMAGVSAHPFIVTVFDAGISRDGRPYLVMEYFRRDHVGVRAQAGMSVAEVLRIGVQVGSAVETLHQAGIVHHDVKPANILLSDFNKPGLTDFGIAGLQDGDPDEESRGASIPYAPPEVVSGRSVGDVRADVYSLGATLYALLARRTPFEHGSPSRAELIQRILTAPVPPLERPDAPRSLELLLQQSMSKDPEQRPQTAALLAAALQGVERELRLDPTPLEVRELDQAPVVSHAMDSAFDRTRAQVSAATVTPARAPSPVPQQTRADSNRGATVARPSRASVGSPHGATVARPAVTPAPPPGSAGATVARPTRAAAPLADVEPPSGPGVAAAGPKDHRKFWAALVAGTAAIAAVAGVVATSGGSNAAPQEASPKQDTSTAAVFAQAPDVPTGLKVVRSGPTVVLTWTSAGDVTADEFEIIRTDVDQPARFTPKSPYRITGIKRGEQACFYVEAGVHATAKFSDPSNTRCAVG